MKAADLIGKKCDFDHAGKRLVGIVTAAVECEPFGRGRIPDFKVTVKGSSGRELTVSAAETFMGFPEPEKTK